MCSLTQARMANDQMTPAKDSLNVKKEKRIKNPENKKVISQSAITKMKTRDTQTKNNLVKQKTEMEELGLHDTKWDWI